MLLSDIKQHLQQQKSLSLAELSQQFQIEPMVMQDMLRVLIRKGQVRQCTKTPRCGKTCNQCSVGVVQLYEWSGKAMNK